MRAVLPVREVFEPVARRVIDALRAARASIATSPRSYVAASPPSAPESSDDH